MSGGESDAAAYRRATLDDFRRCSALGCEIEVYAGGPDAVRCHAHGGRDGIPEYLMSATDGSLIHARHLSLPMSGECE